MQAVLPKDILADGEDSTTMNGRQVRKGTVAAFLANILILEKANSSEEEKNMALNTMKELAPDIIAIGLQQHVVFKNKQVQQILLEADNSY